MIELKQPIKQSGVQEKKQPAAPPKIPYHLQDSIEADFIREKIAANKAYLEKCTNAALYRKVEKDTLFLENNILPIILTKTNLFYNEAAKKFVSYLDRAVQSECHALNIYYPISDKYTNEIKVGVGNCRQNKEFGSLGAVDVYVEIVSMEGNEVPISAILLENTIA